MERLKNIGDLKNLRLRLSKETFRPDRNRMRICCGTGCTATGSGKVVKLLEDEISKKGLDVEIVMTGCQGLCQKGPVMKAEPYGYFYQKVHAEKTGEILSTTYAAGLPVRELLYRGSFLDNPIEIMEEVPFYKKQLRVALRHNGIIDPCNILHYIAVGGYGATEKIFSSLSPEAVLEEVKKANLRGRGGAGFPAGVKWGFAKKATGTNKIVIANGDEGDPGAFMDRSIMEGDPHSLLEGMLICAYAIGAKYGFIYVRHEYPLAVKNLQIAIKQAEELGLLGRNILGTGFDFTVHIRQGAGAFVCGEETALMTSIEGKRGMPRPRPPFPVERGLWGKSTVINNVETLANIPYIIEKGADWFLTIGTQNSPGTKVFALTGKVLNTGLVEVPMGITLREIVFDIGGGIIDNKKFKAVQTGGPSGGCIPEQYLDLPVDFDSLSKVGSIMGSGGMVVMDEDNCMVDVAKFFLSFTQSESCGKCPPCSIGTYQMLQILERITSGNGEEGDIEKLEKIGKLVIEGSLCGLGKTAPNPVLTTIRYFRDEYEEHIRDKFCKAKVCNIGYYWIEHEECILCGLCKQACAFDAIVETRSSFFIDRDYCTRCKACFRACPVNAVKVMKKRQIRLEEELKMPFEKVEIVEKRTVMTLKDILLSKPPLIVTIDKGHTVNDAIKTMSEHNVSGIFVVDENNKLVSIFTERDIVRCMSKNIDLNEVIKNIMRHDIITFDALTKISSAIATASREKIRHLPVVEDDKIDGMITFRDLVFYLLPEISYVGYRSY
jgi:NADH:ubiquinone oxidoreductase subunit F (NADH-binding)/CBS domain-containing protein/(2Fe-2S) ferredoxin/Pyruvate/2-oxoacid:ferredoxin oxidoreductase delta subunit